MKLRLLLIILFSLTIFHPFSLQAETKEIVIGTSTGYPPFYYFDETIKGACPEIIETVFQKMGYKVRFVQYPWKRMLFVGKSGKVHAIMPLFKTPQRETFLHFHKNALAYEDNRLFSLNPPPLKAFQNLMDLKPYFIGTIKSYSYGAEFDNANYLEKLETNDETHLIKLIRKKRVELGIGSKPVILHYARQAGMSAGQISFLSPYITRDALYLGFSKAKDTEKLSMNFSKQLKKFKATNGYKKIIQKYNLQ